MCSIATMHVGLRVIVVLNDNACRSTCFNVRQCAIAFYGKKMHVDYSILM